jgi:hypothetical protein
MTLKPSALTLQMLEWVAERPRTYEEAMEAWKTSCPRLSIWEDALLDQLIALSFVETRERAASIVAVTESGRALLEDSRPT